MATLMLQPHGRAPWSMLDDDMLQRLQGDEGRAILNAVREVTSHVRARPSQLLEAVESGDPFTYEPVPFKIVGTVRVKYRNAGRLEPLPYPDE